MNVTYHTPGKLAPDMPMDEYAARAHANHGWPVRVSYWRGNNGNTLHLSLDEARALHAQLASLFADQRITHGG